MEISSLISRIQTLLPLPPGHRLRLRMGVAPVISVALDEIQQMVAIKKSPVRSTVPDLDCVQLKS
ncbi:MAG: hypothetical protein ACKVHO_12320 [Verrucomicrobiia bacterium]|jgi:hypothetical protein